MFFHPRVKGPPCFTNVDRIAFTTRDLVYFASSPFDRKSVFRLGKQLFYTYKHLPKDPAKACEHKMKMLLSGFKDTIRDSIYRRTNTTDGNTARLYGLPKIHKQETPLQPELQAS